MQEKETLKNVYSNIRNLLFIMIPERWESIYLYASVIESKKRESTGEMFFYYYPKSVIRKNPVNVYEVPMKFNINENEYMELAKQLYDSIKKLRMICNEIEKILWTNITISIENVEFLAEYNDDDLKNSMYTSEERRTIWKYKYLDYPTEKMSKEEKASLKRYLEEEEMGGHKIKVYTETFYQKHEHNDIKYGREQIIKEPNDNKMNIVDKSKYEVDNTNDRDEKSIKHSNIENDVKIKEKKVKSQLLKLE